MFNSNFTKMKKQILSFLFVLGLGLFMANTAFAVDETLVSRGSTITYNVTPSLGTANTYVWSVSAGGTIGSGQGTNEITVTWNTAGAQTVTVQMTDANGCLTEPLIRNVTVNDSKWNLTAETNNTTCALMTTPLNGSGNNQPGMVPPTTDLADLTSFQVAITAAIAGNHIVAYTVSDTESHTKSYTQTAYTSGGTITLTHNADADLINMFTNGTGATKTVTIYVDSVTDPNGSVVSYEGTKRSYTVTVYPKSVIAF